MPSLSMNRRRFLSLAGGASCAVVWNEAEAAMQPFGGRTLVLVELNGGNDGLNMVVPYGDPAYYKLRPKLGIARDRVLALDEGLGLHPSMGALRKLWQEKKLGIALGVGYPDPNLSHFRSIEIWNTGSDTHELLDEGWVARAFAEAGAMGRMDADGMVLGDRSEVGPLFGPRMNVIGIDNPEAFVKRASQMHDAEGRPLNPALAHVIETQRQVKTAAKTMLERKLDQVDPGGAFPDNPFGRQLKIAAQLIVGDIQVPVVKVALTGFDTHRGQADPHGRLLEQLSDGLLAFTRAMEAKGHWDKVLVMTYAEFGRRAAENASGGTDHGTAAPHFILGGRVRGGFYGGQPALGDLIDGNLRHRLHFRSLAATAVRDWWGLKGGFIPEPSLPCLASV